MVEARTAHGAGLTGAAPDQADGATATTLRETWRSVTCDATLDIEVAPSARDVRDPRVVASIAAVLHAAAARGASTLLVAVTGDGRVAVHDDAGPPPRRLGVLASTARDALAALGARLEHSSSPRLGGTCVTIRRPTAPERD